MDTLIAALLERQRLEGWTDRDMARELGLGNATWTRVRNGSRGMGTYMVARALHRFPEYSALAMTFFLSGGASLRHVSVSERNEEAA